MNEPTANTAQGSVKILVVDDHPLISCGLKSMLTDADPRFEVVDIAASVAEANSIIDEHCDLDLVLLDILLPDGNGIEVLNHLREQGLATKVLAVSSVDDIELIVNLVKAGLDGFVSKGSNETIMMEAVRSVLAGLEYFGKPIEQFLADVELNSQMQPILTNREIEIIRLTAEGLSAKEAADKLFVSRRTIEAHKARIFSKLKINTTSELVRYAFRYKLIRIN